MATTDRSLRDIGPDKSLLIVDDDEPFLRRLERAMEKRGFEVEAAGDWRLRSLTLRVLD